MDFIPKLQNITKRKNRASKKVSKLSLKSHKQCSQSLSQSCSQVESEIVSDDGGCSSFFSQPASAGSSFELNRHSKLTTTTSSNQVSAHHETLSTTQASVETSSISNSTVNLSPLKPKPSRDDGKFITNLQTGFKEDAAQRTEDYIGESSKISSPIKTLCALNPVHNEEKGTPEQIVPHNRSSSSFQEIEKSSSITSTNPDKSPAKSNLSQSEEVDSIFKNILKKVLSPIKKSLNEQECVETTSKINPSIESSSVIQNEEKLTDMKPLSKQNVFLDKASSITEETKEELSKPKSETNDKSKMDVLTIDLISSPDEEQILENENEKTKQKSNKPALGKLKQLKTRSETLKASKEVEESCQIAEKNKIKQKVDAVKKISENKKVKQTKSKTDCDGSDCDGALQDSDNEEDYSNPLEGKSQFVTKLRKFERLEPKKLHHHSSPSKLLEKDVETSNTPEKKETLNDEQKMSPKTTKSPLNISMNNDTSFRDFKAIPFKSDVKESEEKEIKEAVKQKREEVTDAENLFDQLPCPICNKQAGKNKRTHMKSCAFKNNIPTAQLIEALNLQKKQAEERIALGLPAVVSSSNQRVFVKKKGVNRLGKDASMELALALSKSLMEAQEHEELMAARRLMADQADFGWEDCAIAASVSDPIPSTSSASAGQMILRPGTGGTVQLQRAGNTARRGRGRNANTGPSVLLQTTQEERERRITQKVAMLLVGDEEQQVNETPSSDLSPPLSIVSSKLSRMQSKSSSLWQLSAVSPSTERETFYVNKLSEFISPSKHQPGENLKHLSQIPGRIKSPERNSGDAEKDMTLCSFIDATQPQPGTSRDSTVPKSPGKFKSKTSSSFLDSKSPRKSEPKERAAPNVTKRQDYAGLSRDWSALLNSRTMSDITIYVNGEHELRAHKLVIFVRCPAMLEDLAMEMTPRGKGVREQMLLWSEVSRGAALAMLEFLYCDTTTRATTLPQHQLEQLIELATRYNVKDLLVHLQMLSRIRNSLTTSSNKNNFLQKSKTPSPIKPLPQTPVKSKSPKLSSIKTLPCTPVKSNHDNIEPKVSSVKSVVSVSSNRSVSPDLFDDEDEEDTRPDIAYLVSMMEKSQNQSTSSLQNQVTASIQNNELKRKISSSISPNSFSSSKKMCKDASFCRKSLLSELENIETKYNGNNTAGLSSCSVKASCDEKSPLVSPIVVTNSECSDKSPSSSPNSEKTNEKSPPESPLSVKASEMNSSQLLDMLEKSSDVMRSNASPIISDVWDNFDEVGLMSASPYHHLDKPKSPESIITISSTSQKSKVSSQDHIISDTEASSVASQDHGFSETGNKTVVSAIEEDSFGVFEEGELSGLERAALNAYNKVVSPLRAQTPAAKIATSSEEITPIADYSIMASPALQKELDKYGIRKLKRNQAKLILRHIYNELHPVVPSTPDMVQSPVTSKRGGTRVVRARGRRGGTSAVSRLNPHDISLSQPDPSRPSTSRQNVHNISLSQPYETVGSSTVWGDSMSQQTEDSDHGSADSSNSSDDDGDSFSELEEMETGGQVLEKLSDVREAMSRLIAADSDLHHRMLMYEPVWVEELQNLLKLNGFRCKPKPLLDYLDEHCITFRLPARQRTQRKRGSPKKPGTQRGLKSPSKRSDTAMTQRGRSRGRRRRAALLD